MMGPGFLPRWLSVGIAICGLALVGSGFLKDGQRLPSIAMRGPVVVMLAILAFAMTIRPVAIGPLTAPGLGLIVAGPLAILLGGYATPEARSGARDPRFVPDGGLHAALRRSPEPADPDLSDPRARSALRQRVAARPASGGRGRTDSDWPDASRRRTWRAASGGRGRVAFDNDLSCTEDWGLRTVSTFLPISSSASRLPSRLQNLTLCFIGCLVGTLIGVLPGVGPIATIAMLMPLPSGAIQPAR